MPATLADKILLVPILGLVLTKTSLAAITGPFRGPSGAPTYFEHVLNTFVRTLLVHISTEQIQWLVPSFVESYKKWCVKNKIAPDVVDIPNTNTQGFWVGNKSTAKYTMLYIHGGGYTFPGVDQHIDLIMRMVKWSNNNLAVFFIAYSLSPDAVYPVALGQCVEALRYLLDLPGHSAETTVIAGDSAGGALTFAVLSHISHPHPQSDLVKPLHLQGNLKGIIGIAVWTSSDSKKYPSMDKFAYRDIVNTRVAEYWIESYKGRGKNVPDDEYVYSALAAPDWWHGVKCDHTLLLAGQEEGLHDAITDLAKKYEQGAGSDKVKFVVGEREIHDAPITAKPEAELAKTGDKTQEGAIRLWIQERLTS